MIRHALQRVALLGLVTTLALSGCADPAGSGAVGVDGKMAAYGISGDEMNFVIFTDFESSEIQATSGGRSTVSETTQYGSFTNHSTGEEVLTYRCTDNTLELNEDEFDLEQGRVFVMTTTGEEDRATVTQLDVPIEPEGGVDTFSAEARRLFQHDRVTPLFAGPEEEDDDNTESEEEASSE